MSHAPWKPSAGPPEGPAPQCPKRSLHRIRAIRMQQGISLRCAARRLNLNLEQVKHLEEETEDMLLSTLYQWQDVLEVPVAELLVDSDAPLSEPILKRARMVKLMKTAAAIRETVKTEPLMRLAQMLVDQLIELMPELKDVSPWHAVGQRRSRDELGRVAERPIPESFFYESDPF